MDPIKRYALDIAKEIIVAKMSNSTIHPNKENGVQVADFFEEIYKRVLALSKLSNVSSRRFSVSVNFFTSKIRVFY